MIVSLLSLQNIRKPSYYYKVYGGAPNHGWGGIPEFSEQNLIRKGVTGKMTTERLDKINEQLFAKVERIGHIETRIG